VAFYLDDLEVGRESKAKQATYFYRL